MFALLLYCSTPCSDDVGNYIKVYASYNERGQPHTFCRSVSYSQLYIFGGTYAYIKFHTNSVVNAKKLRGFSKVKFTARGMLNMTIKSVLRNQTISDINECASNYCDHSCTNLAGSYKCSCRKGYYLAGTRRCFGKTLTVINVITISTMFFLLLQILMNVAIAMVIVPICVSTWQGLTVVNVHLDIRCYLTNFTALKEVSTLLTLLGSQCLLFCYSLSFYV